MTRIRADVTHVLRGSTAVGVICGVIETVTQGWTTSVVVTGERVDVWRGVGKGGMGASVTNAAAATVKTPDASVMMVPALMAVKKVGAEYTVIRNQIVFEACMIETENASWVVYRVGQDEHVTSSVLSIARLVMQRRGNASSVHQDILVPHVPMNAAYPVPT